LSKFRKGFGGNVTVARKSSNSCISAGVRFVSSPCRPMNAPLNSSRPSRSPRQWSGSFPMMSCSVCVVIGPFIGCHGWKPVPCPGSPAPRFWPVTGLHVPGRVAEVPREAIEAAVDVAGPAGDLAEAGVLVRVVQVLAAELDRLRRGVVERNSGGLELARDVDDRDRRFELVEHEEASVRGVEHDPGRALADVDRRAEPDAVAGRVDHDQVVRAHPRDVGARARGVPRDPARIADRAVAVGLGDRRSEIGQVGVEVLDPERRRPGGVDARDLDAREASLDVGLEPDLVRGLRAD
jgi:hypothetical protein